MNWKDSAIDRLRRYDAMRLAVSNIPAEIARLEVQASSIRGARIDSTPVNSGGSGREDAMLTNLVQRKELEWSLEQAKNWVKTVDNALSALSPEQRLVLTRLYIMPERKNIERLCMELGMEHSSIYRRRDQALHRFTIALYGFISSDYCLPNEN